jgi:hypothetical protein
MFQDPDPVRDGYCPHPVGAGAAARLYLYRERYRQRLTLTQVSSHVPAMGIPIGYVQIH